MTDTDGMTRQLHNLSDITADEALTASNIESFFKVMANTVHYPAQDQVLIWKQDRNASDVAGIRKWKMLGCELREDARPILILLPYIRCIHPGIPKRNENGEILTDNGTNIIFEKEPEYETGYTYTSVFDVSAVKGEKTTMVRDLSILEDKLKEWGVVIIDEPAEKMPPASPEGYVEDMTFHVLAGLRRDREKYQATLLKIFCDWIVLSIAEPGDPEASNNHIDIVTSLVKCGAENYFFGKSQINPKLAVGKIKNLSHEEKKNLIYTVSDNLFQIVQYISEKQLSFNDTAVLNGILDTGNKYDMIVSLQRLQRQLEEKGYPKSFNDLYDKLLCAYDNAVTDLYNKKLHDKVLYTTPPIRLPVKIKE